MSSPFVAEIRIFAGNFAPNGWAFCDGQLLPISQNTALFSLIGTYYGGDGKSTFALPDLRGSVPIGQGQGEGLSEYVLGQSGGSATVTLIPNEMPQHTHTAMSAGTGVTGTESAPKNDLVWADTKGAAYSTSDPTLSMSGLAMGVAGGGQPHNNRQPYLGLTFIIAMQGVFPPRS